MGQQRVDADPPRGGAEGDRVHDPATRLLRQSGAQSRQRERRVIADVGVQDGLIVLGQGFNEGRSVGPGRPGRGHDAGLSSAGAQDSAHGHDAR